jgi:hypothetical protein
MDNKCRLCENELTPSFQQKVLNLHLVQYFLCINCLSLQTENPYWVADSYENSLSILDTGAIQRVLYNASLATWVIRLLKVGNVVDFGGGDGMLTRLLRDQHVDCYVYDKYASNSYAQGFELQGLNDVELVLAFEVLEHFIEPHKDLDLIFKNQPKFVLLSTSIYNGQDSNWWYLTPDTGQHIFFYSQKALNLIGQRYKYHVLTCGNYTLFSLKLGFFKKTIIRLILNRRTSIIVKLMTLCASVSGSDVDHKTLRQRITEPGK